MQTSAAPQLSLQGLTKRFGGLVAVDSVDLDIVPGERIGLIGPNGAGKSTLVNLLSGNLAPSEGTVQFDGEPIDHEAVYNRVRRGIVKTFQDKRIFVQKTVKENLKPVVTTASQADSDRHASIPSGHEADIDDQIESLLSFVQIPEAYWETEAAQLPILARSRLSICLALATYPSILLLDEPMAGLNAEESAEIQEIIQRVNENGVTTVLIEHDIDVVFSLCNRVVVLNLGEKIADGDPAQIRQNEQVKQAYIGTGG